MLKKKIEAPATLGEIFSAFKSFDPSMSEKIEEIEVVDNLGGSEVYVPHKEDLDHIPVGKGALVILKLDHKPIGGIGFF